MSEWEVLVVICTVRVGWYYGLIRLVVFQGMSAVCVTTHSVRICMLECLTLFILRLVVIVSRVVKVRSVVL